MVGRSFYRALDVKIMDRLVRVTRIQSEGGAFYSNIMVNI
jgi:hypothetical protein